VALFVSYYKKTSFSADEKYYKQDQDRKDEIMDNLGERLRRHRLKRGWSISELALKSGVAKSYLSNVERNIKCNPSIQIMEKVANAMQIPLEMLLLDPLTSNDINLDQEWRLLVWEAIASGIRKEEFREFLDYQRWKQRDPFSQD
jgi:XRE family transcriptional regulator of biofilm formation